jgi:nicotinamide phosphoribosyltransferase
MDRDTCSMAFKCSAVYRNGTWHDVYKEPVTDPGKNSHRGRLVLTKRGNMFFTEKMIPEREKEDFMRVIYRNGEMVVTDTLAQIRQRAWGNLGNQ